MNKIYKFLFLMLFFLTGSLSAFADAERDWTVWEISENQIEAPEDGMYVVLQQGNYAYWSINGYLNPSGVFLSAVDATCIYELIKVGFAEDGSDVYVLQNVSNKQYLCIYNKDTGYYTYSLSEAFQCTIRKADASSTDPRSMIYDGGSRQPGADGVNWIFCNKNLSESEDESKNQYLCYFRCPVCAPYTDTNDWKVYEATPHAASVDEKLETIYNEVFKNGFPNEIEFTVGTEPGSISQELYNKLEAAYRDAKKSLGNASVSDEKKEKIVSNLVNIQDELNNGGRIMLEPGKFYMFINQRSYNGMYDNNGVMACTRYNDEITAPTLAEARYIWGVEDAGDGKYYIYNYATGRYAGIQNGQSGQLLTTDTPQTKCIVTLNPDIEFLYGGPIFYITDDIGNMWYNDANNKIVTFWQSKNGYGCSFVIKEVSAEIVEQLKPVVEKAQFMTKFNDKIDEAKEVSQKYRYFSDVTFDDKYDAEGLVTSFEAANATEPAEGSEASAFDGDVNTFYHTLWFGNKDGEYHWVQVNLGEEPIQKLFLKFTQRHNNRYGNPTRIALVAPASTDDPEGAWTDTLYKDTVIYEYTTTFSTGIIPNTTAIIRVNLGKPVTQLRFVGLQTKANQLHGLGPCWHVSELRFYKDGGDNPRYALIPEEIRQGLTDAIAHAEELASDSSATQADYEVLDKAIKAFNASYYDYNNLLSTIYKQAVQEKSSANNYKGDYLPNDGLITDASQFSSNAKEESEGTFEGLIDNDRSTFFHSLFKYGDYNVKGHHYIQIDLRDTYENIVLKYSARSGYNEYGDSYSSDGSPKIIHIYVTNTPEDENSWIDLGKRTCTYDFIKDVVGLLSLDMPAPYQHIRLVVEETMGNNYGWYGIKSGPYFHWGELHAYPKYSANRLSVLSNEELSAFNKIMSLAEKELSEGIATKETCTALKEQLVNLETKLSKVKISDFSKSSYTTLYSDKPMVVPEGMEAAVVVSNGDEIHNDYRYKTGMTIPAYTGVLLRGGKGNSFLLAEGETEENAPSDNLLHGTLEDEIGYIPGYYNYYKLSYDAATGTELGFYWGSKNGAPFMNKAGKAFLAIPVAASQSLMGVSLFDLDNGLATGINETTTDAGSGTLKIYDLNGRRIDAKSTDELQRGIYVVNGKKMYVK